MGLGAPKNRSKLSHDPNNTAWSRSTENFGHRILSSQGWKPGDYLGATNAAHSDHYTAANASHVRVLLREDNLGIGAKIGGKGNAETFGLSTLSSIFGRLNGKSDVELQTQQSHLRNAELRTYQAQKYGFMNFVSGGLLVGDKMEEPVKDVSTEEPEVVDVDAQGSDDRSSKKRKAEDVAPDSAKEKPLKKKRRSSDLRAAAKISQVEESEASPSNPSSEPRRSKKKHRSDKDTAAPAISTEKTQVESEDSDDPERKIAKRARKAARKAERASRRLEKEGSSDDKARSREEKRARKEERRKRKEQKRLAKADAGEPESAVSLATPSSGVSTPGSAAMLFGSRHAVRQRYILQKRMASLDPQALKEILMIKAQG